MQSQGAQISALQLFSTDSPSELNFFEEFEKVAPRLEEWLSRVATGGKAIAVGGDFVDGCGKDNIFCVEEE